jgi:hypothetical protein
VDDEAAEGEREVVVALAGGEGEADDVQARGEALEGS